MNAVDDEPRAENAPKPGGSDTQQARYFVEVSVRSIGADPDWGQVAHIRLPTAWGGSHYSTVKLEYLRQLTADGRLATIKLKA